MAYSVGTAYVSVIPQLSKTFNASVSSQMSGAGTVASKSFGSKFASGLGTVAKVGGLALGGAAVYGAAAFAKNAVSLEAEFSKTLNVMGAVAEVPKKQLGTLSDLAIKMGQDTVFSANDAANAMLELAKTGITPAVIQSGALKEALTLAAAGGIEMEQAATVMGNALNTFNLKGKDSSTVAAALAGAANASSASIGSLADGLQQVGSVAADSDQSVEETTAGLAALANAGIAGSDAGTTLKTMFARLIPSTKTARNAFQSFGLSSFQAKGSMDDLAKLGIEPLTNKYGDVHQAIGEYVTAQSGAVAGSTEHSEAIDNVLNRTGLMQNAFVKQNGEFKGMAQIAGVLSDRFGDMSSSERAAAFNTLFGSDARRAATVLTNEGAKGLAKYIKATSDSTAADKAAAAQMKGTAGAIEQRKGSIETLGLAFGLAIQPLVQFGNLMVAKIANKAVPIIEDLGGELKRLIENGPSISNLGKRIGDAFAGIDWSAIRTAFNGIDWSAFGKIDLSKLKDARKELPSFTDLLKVAGVVLRFAADHVDLLAKALPFLGAGFLLVKAAQVASNAAATVAIPLRVAELVVHRQLVRSNAQLVVSMGAATTASGVNTAAESLNTTAKSSGIVASVRSRVATVAKAVAEKAAAAASKALAAATWLVNLAMRANPIGIAITLLVAFGASLVVAYKKSDTFRRIVEAAWAGVKKAAADAWASIKAMLRALVAGFGYTADKIADAWRSVTQSTKITWELVKTTISNEWAKITGLVSDATAKVKSTLATAWSAIRAAVVDDWNAVVDKISDAFANIKQRVSDGISAVKTILSNGWSAVKTGTATAWDAVKTTIGSKFDAIRDGVSDKVSAVKTLMSNAWDAVRDNADRAWSGIVSVIQRAFGLVQKAVGTPIYFVLDTVINDKLIAGFNKISGFVDGPTIDTIDVSGIPRFARGGVFPGYTPGRDIGYAAVSGGEAIMRPEWTKAVGEDQINAMNKAAREGGVAGVKNAMHGEYFGGYFQGGTLPVAGASVSVHPQPYYSSEYAADLNGPGEDYGQLIKAWKAGIVASVTDMGDTSYGRLTKINHPDSDQATWYAHQSAFLVNAGNAVSAGQAIGRIGDYGNASGPHLHFEIHGASSGIGSPSDVAGALNPTGSDMIQLPDFVTNPLEFLRGQISGALDSSLLDSPLGQMLKGIPGRLIESMVDKVKSLAGSAVNAAQGFGINTDELSAIPLLVRAMNKARGWDDQWSSLYELVKQESSFNPVAQNPTSTAFGLFQFLDSTWATVGGTKTENPVQQTQYGLDYIGQRYGGPDAAWDFHQANNWYDAGGYLQPGTTMARNRTGKPEPVLTNEQWKHIKTLIQRTFVGGSPRDITSGFLRDQMGAVPKTADQLKDRYSAALAEYRKQLEQARGARERLTNAETRASTIAKALVKTQKELTSAQGDLGKLKTEKEINALLEDRNKVVGRASAEAEKANAVVQKEQDRLVAQARRALDNAAKPERAAAEKALAKARESAERQIQKVRAKGERAVQKARADELRHRPALRAELKLRERIADRVEKIQKRLKAQGATEKEISKTLRLRTRDMDAQQGQADRAKEAADRTAAAYAEAQKAAVEKAKGISSSVTALGSLSSSMPSSALGLKRMLRNAIRIGREWGATVKRLIRGGLRGPLLDEFIEQGPSQTAISLGRDLLRSGSIDDVLRMQARLQRIGDRAGRLGAATPRQAGRVSPRRGGRVTPNEPLNAGNYTDSHDRHIHFDGPVYAHDPHRLAQKIHEKDRRALSLLNVP